MAKWDKWVVVGGEQINTDHVSVDASCSSVLSLPSSSWSLHLQLMPLSAAFKGARGGWQLASALLICGRSLVATAWQEALSNKLCQQRP